MKKMYIYTSLNFLLIFRIPYDRHVPIIMIIILNALL